MPKSDNKARLARSTVVLETVSFVDAFCRRNLSSEEIAIINKFVEKALAFDEMTTEQDEGDTVNGMLRKLPTIVTLAPQKAR